MTASAKIVTEKKDGVLVLPLEGIRPGNKVKVVTGSGEKIKTEERTVTLGLKNDASVQILTGLKDGERVEVPNVEAGDRRKVEFGPGGGG